MGMFPVEEFLPYLRIKDTFGRKEPYPSPVYIEIFQRKRFDEVIRVVLPKRDTLNQKGKPTPPGSAIHTFKNRAGQLPLVNYVALLASRIVV